MNKGISKWPARALNLLVVLAMVIALCAVLAPPMVGAAAAACDPVERYGQSCNLEVFVNTYTKDAGGNFTPVSAVGNDTCYYVNAVVVNSGNATAGINLNAILAIDHYAVLDPNCAPAGNLTQVWAPELLVGGVADFWWKVCCNGTGNTTFTVTAASNCRQGNVTGSASVLQGVTETTKCVEIRIVEAPGLPATVVGRLGTYTNTYLTTVAPCTSYGIKAEITNLCDRTLGNVTGNITIEGANASLVGGDPSGWSLGNITRGKTEVVAWTVHCDAPGDAVIWVKATGNATGGNGSESLDLITDYIDDSVTVRQFGAGNLLVEIVEPGDCTEIPQGGTCSPTQSNFPIRVKVTNDRDLAAVNAYVRVTGNNSAILGFGLPLGGDLSTLVYLGNLTPGQIVYADAWGVCKGNGTVTITATGGADSIVEVADTLVVYQKYVIATIDSVNYGNVTANVDPDGEYSVNVCQEFTVTGSFANYSSPGTSRIFQTYIYWTGNATLLFGTGDDPQFKRLPASQVWENFSSVNTVIGGNASAGWYNYQTPTTICNCCDTLVRWTFQCNGTAPGEFYVKMVDAATGTTYVDDSSFCPGNTTVNQDWKAHLIAGLTPFIQDECGMMLNRTAFAPGQYFHMVIPVVNTGNATAENVVVTYHVIGSGTRYDYKSTSGDAVSGSFDEVTGVGTATLGNITGGSAKKAILLFLCTGEGQVEVLITGISGIDENTEEAIPADNKIIPPCSTVLKQIPLTVEIKNPYTCQNFRLGANFAVKALITNGSSTETLGNVSATVYWGNGSVLYQGAALMGNQTKTKDLGNATNHSALPNSQHEITWEFECTAEGDVIFWVTTTTLNPYLTAISSDEVTVHQLDCIDIGIDILSPRTNGYRDGSYEQVYTNTTIATSEEFAVTALVNCTGSVGLEAEDVEACITLPDGVALGEGETLCKTVGNGTMVGGDQETVTWTLHALWTGNMTCNINETVRISGNVTTTSDECTGNLAHPNTDYVDIAIYPAAHLVAEIVSITPASPFVVCEEFEVKYRVYNYGEADAWEVEAVLSVDPAGSVRIAEGEGGYTRYLGTIAGWKHYSGSDSYIEDTFTLHCKQACESTITITPKGNDECGWHWIWVYSGAAGYTPVWLYEGNSGDRNEYSGYYKFVSLPGREIDAEFIEPASQTVKQVVSGGVDLSIDKTADNLFPTVGQTVKFTVVVTNTGPAEATGIVVSDPIPGNLTMSSHTKTQGTYTGGVWTVGSLAAGSSATLVINCTVGSVSAITNTATITALGQVDPFSDNNTDSVTLNLAAVTSMDIALKTGWNLISLPLIPNNSAIATVLAGVLGNVSIVYGYDPSAGWKSYIPGGPTPSLTTMVDGKGYWINMIAAATLTVNGVVNPLPPTTPPAYSVAAGWNLIGFKSTTAMTAGDYLAAIAGQWTRIWGYTNGQYGAVTSSGMLQPGGGYWIAVTSAGTIFP